MFVAYRLFLQSSVATNVYCLSPVCTLVLNIEYYTVYGSMKWQLQKEATVCKVRALHCDKYNVVAI